MLSRTEFVKRRMFSPPDIFRNVLFFAVMLYIFNQLFCDCVLLNCFFSNAWNYTIAVILRIPLFIDNGFVLLYLYGVVSCGSL